VLFRKFAFFVGALRARGDQFLKDIFHDDLANRRSRGEFLLQIKNRKAAAAWEDRLRAFLKKLDQQHGRRSKSLTPRGIADIGPVKRSYIYYAQLSADAAHPTTDSLSRYLTRFEEDGIPGRGIDVEPVIKPIELSDTLNWVCEAALGVIIGVNEILGGTAANSEIIQAAEKYRALNKIEP
jgi:hypothetical protein